ncbi:hypothetical protein DCE93_13480 [Agromyces badenianii]|uniref:DUF3151 family protein n=1 Tax=Agromyces badenianii TaxID=2080742 RepID=A0A2S0X0D0_9MICO|nr:hypothetical protein DCE93_13480 [Agromyces badenianii]
MPTRSPTGRLVRTFDMPSSLVGGAATLRWREGRSEGPDQRSAAPPPPLPEPRTGLAVRLSVTADQSASEPEASLADEPEVRRALAAGDRTSVSTVVAGHPSSPLAWTELADLADSEGRAIESFAFASVAADFAREQLTAAGWQPGDLVPWSDEPNRAYLRALDTQRRAAQSLGLGDRAARLADELATADAGAPARIASEFTPTQLITIISTSETFTPATSVETHTGDPLAEPAASDAAAGED